MFGLQNNQDQYLDDPDNSTKYLRYNKPSLDTVNYSIQDLLLKLHFAKNQSRKYFWNNFRKNQDGKVHHIFDPNSRLKVSSMRLIRKHNAIKQHYEYYLSLSIYRLEDSNVQITTKDVIHGYDIGENSLLEVSTVNLNSGQKLNTYFNSIAFSHFQNHKNSQNLIFNEVESSITKKNYISPKTRKKIHDKSLAVQRQASSFISKEAIKGNYNIFEHQYIQKIHSNKQNSKDNLIKKTMYNLVKRASQKIDQELDSQTVLSGNINLINDKKANSIKYSDSDILSIVQTADTSQICSNCGHKATKNFDYQSFQEDILKGQTSFDLKDYRILEGDWIDKDILSQTNKLFEESYSRNENLWKVDLSSIDQRIGVQKEFKNALNEHFESQIDTIFKFLKSDSDQNPAYFRPKWIDRHTDRFRCFACGYVTECDSQAALNIARMKLYESHLKNEQTIVSLEKAKLSHISDKNSKDNLYRIKWYQQQLLKHGYNPDGTAKWNDSK
ncbi:MAG: hypothetical protein HC932_04070 [Thermales bacterium]|nr:hypothetical protein [Thermales bacterium]